MIRLLIKCQTLFFFLLLVPGLVWAQFPNNPNKTNGQGKKEGKWTVLYDKEWNETTDKNQALYYRVAQFENGQAIGKVQDYYADGQLQMDIESIIASDPEKYHGEVIQYRKNGTLAKYEYFNQGKLDVNKTGDYYIQILEKTANEKGNNSREYFDVLNQVIQLILFCRRFP